MRSAATVTGHQRTRTDAPKEPATNSLRAPGLDTGPVRPGIPLHRRPSHPRLAPVAKRRRCLAGFSLGHDAGGIEASDVGRPRNDTQERIPSFCSRCR